MRSATRSWKRPGNNGRFVASKPLEVKIARLCCGYRSRVCSKLAEGSKRLKFKPLSRPLAYRSISTAMFRHFEGRIEAGERLLDATGTSLGEQQR
jgi:hypothetical protein